MRFCQQQFDNDIYGNAMAGVEISGEGSEAVVERNRIFDNRTRGVNIVKQAKGTVGQNLLLSNGSGAADAIHAEGCVQCYYFSFSEGMGASSLSLA